MIKTVGSIELQEDFYGNFLISLLPLVSLPVAIIFSVTIPQSFWYASIVFFTFSIVSLIGTMFFSIKKQKVVFSYLTVFLFFIFAISCCLYIAHKHTYLFNYIQLLIFAFSLYFFWAYAKVIFGEFKKLLLYKFIKKEHIKLYAPSDDIAKENYHNYWSPVDPNRIKFYDTHKKEAIIPDKNIFVSIRSTATENISNAFSPILRLIACRKILKEGNMQQYFNILYFSLIIVNFLYFFSALFITKTLFLLHLRTEFIYLFMVTIILSNLFMSMYLFIYHLDIPECKAEQIYSDLSSNISDYHKIDSHYITLNQEKRFFHDKELERLKEANIKLSGKLDSIYQVSTPILFLSQVTLSLAAITYFKDSIC